MNDRKDRVAWDNRPARVSGASQLILSVLPGPAKEYLIASTAITGVWTHYVEKRTVPCMGSPTECCVDHRFTSKRWQGWIAVQHLATAGRWGWVCITESAFHRCPGLMADSGSLRGRTIRLGRTGKESNSAMMAQLDPLPADKRRLMVEPDAVEFLLGLWGNLDQYRRPGAARGKPELDRLASCFSIEESAL